MDAQAAVANAQMKQAGIEMQIDTGGRHVENLMEYVHLGPLAQAFSTPGSVLLLDEIDKAPRELPTTYCFFSQNVELLFRKRSRQFPVSQGKCR